MVERFTITAAEQDPWVDVDANGQWVRYADYAAEREQWINYTTDLQRIIEALCGNRKLPQPVSSARHHYNMAERALAERAGGVNEDALRALAQAYDREDAAQRGEPDPWNLDDPGDIGDSDTWVSERLACARAAAEAFLSALSRTGAVKVELSGNSGELIDRMAEAIRDWGSHYDDGPWETLPEDRKAGWRGDAERALAVVKEYLMARALSSPDHIADAGKVEGDGRAYLERFWRPISEADKSITFDETFDIGDGKSMTIRNSDHYWVRDADGRVYEATWSYHKGGYWWDLEGESPVDPVEYMPHPLSLPSAPALGGAE